MSFAEFAQLAPAWLPWGFAHVAGALSTLDPWIFYPALLASALACLAVKFAPRARRFWCAAPFLPAGALFVWAAASVSPAFFTLLPLAACPLALWVASLGPDPMRAALTDETDA